MKRHDLVLTGVAAASVLFAAGCARLAVGILLDEKAAIRLGREQLAARGPANRDPAEVGRTTSDDGGYW